MVYTKFLKDRKINRAKGGVRMLNAYDQEKLVKSSQMANLLVQDLRELVKSDNPLLGAIANEILQQAVQIEQRLNRIKSTTQTLE
jgi:hypothetical protein